MNNSKTPGELQRLYEKAWSDHGAACLWNVIRQNDPTPEHAGVVGRILKRRGNLDAVFLGHRLAMLADAA